jgi:hypothetical protein
MACFVICLQALLPMHVQLPTSKLAVPQLLNICIRPFGLAMCQLAKHFIDKETTQLPASLCPHASELWERTDMN